MQTQRNCLLPVKTGQELLERKMGSKLLIKSETAFRLDFIKIGILPFHSPTPVKKVD
jgi:hypothetical protein